MYVKCESWPLVDINNPSVHKGTILCFYCREPVGQPHGQECVCVTKLVRYLVYFESRLIGTFTYHDPCYWTIHNSEFHKNGSSWCQDNALDDIEYLDPLDKERLLANLTEGVCLCNLDVEFKYDETIDPGPYII